MQTQNSASEGVVHMWILPRLYLRVHLLAVLCPGERDMMYTADYLFQRQPKVLIGLSVS